MQGQSSSPRPTRPPSESRLSRSWRTSGTVVRSLLWVLFGLWFFSLPSTSHGEDEAFPENQLKAALIYNFTKFTTWPSNAFASAKSPIKIAIVGQGPFAPLISSMILGKNVGGRSLVVTKKQFGDDLSDCQLVFISRSEKDHLFEILNELNGKPVLTISEIDKFGENGGMVRLFVTEQRLRFELNARAVEAAGLQISAKLAALGTLVKSQPGRK